MQVRLGHRESKLQEVHSPGARCSNGLALQAVVRDARHGLATRTERPRRRARVAVLYVMCTGAGDAATTRKRVERC